MKMKMKKVYIVYVHVHCLSLEVLLKFGGISLEGAVCCFPVTSTVQKSIAVNTLKCVLTEEFFWEELPIHLKFSET